MSVEAGYMTFRRTEGTLPVDGRFGLEDVGGQESYGDQLNDSLETGQQVVALGAGIVKAEVALVPVKNKEGLVIGLMDDVPDIQGALELMIRRSKGIGNGVLRVASGLTAY